MLTGSAYQKLILQKKFLLHSFSKTPQNFAKLLPKTIHKNLKQFANKQLIKRDKREKAETLAPLHALTHASSSK
jgi:hypothetical protein